MKNAPEIKWLDAPEEHNYPATASYLSLFYDNQDVEKLIKQLRESPILEFKAKDIFRAS